MAARSARATARILAPPLPDAPPAGPADDRVTFEQFMAWVDEDSHAELVEGRLVEMAPIADEHQFLLLFLAATLGEFVQVHALGKLIVAPFAMRLGSGATVREPDLLFVAQANLGRWHPTFLDGPADLAVEITSPESLTRDRGEKYIEYEQAGVAEYWLLDPRREHAEFYQLAENGVYRFVPPEPDGVYRSRELHGLWLRTEWLWRDPQPPYAEVRREWGLP